MEYLFFLGVPFVIWLFYRLILANQRWEFDWDTANSTFTLLLGHYLSTVKWMIVLDILLAIAAVRMEVSGAAARFGLAGAVYGTLFTVWLLQRYEAYLHEKYLRNGEAGVSPYTTSQYAITLALGLSTVLFTVGCLIIFVITL